MQQDSRFFTNYRLGAAALFVDVGGSYSLDIERAAM
jgi:hypothetical protein